MDEWRQWGIVRARLDALTTQTPVGSVISVGAFFEVLDTDVHGKRVVKRAADAHAFYNCSTVPFEWRVHNEDVFAPEAVQISALPAALRSAAIEAANIPLQVNLAPVFFLSFFFLFTVFVFLAFWSLCRASFTCDA